MRAIRVLSLCFLIMTTVVAPALLQAQSGSYGLSDADYEIIEECLFNSADADSELATSLQFEFELEASWSGLTETGEMLLIELEGAGMLGGDPDDPRVAFDFTGTMTVGDETLPFDIGVRFMDDAIYLRGFNAENLDQWYELGIDDLLSVALGGALDPDMLEMMIEMQGAGGQSPVGELFGEIDPEDYIEGERLPDEEINGEPHAHFVFEVDVQDFIESPDVQVILSFVGMLINPGSMNSMMGGFDGVEFSDVVVNQYCSLDTLTISRGVIQGTLEIDGEELEIENMQEDSELTFELDMQPSGYGEDYEIEEPDDAEELELNP